MKLKKTEYIKKLCKNTNKTQSDIKCSSFLNEKISEGHLRELKLANKIAIIIYFAYLFCTYLDWIIGGGYSDFFWCKLTYIHCEYIHISNSADFPLWKTDVGKFKFILSYVHWRSLHSTELTFESLLAIVDLFG